MLVTMVLRTVLVYFFVLVILRLMGKREIRQLSPFDFVVAHGRLVPEEMRRARYNLDDILAQLREKGYADLSQVEFAILETSGELSVIPREGGRPGLAMRPGRCDGLPRVLVMDGEVEHENLAAAGLDENWLLGELAARGLAVRDVFIAMLARDGTLFVQPRRDAREDSVK